MSRVGWWVDCGGAGERAGAVRGVHHLHIFRITVPGSGLPPLVSLLPKAALAWRSAQTLTMKDNLTTFQYTRHVCVIIHTQSKHKGAAFIITCIQKCEVWKYWCTLPLPPFLSLLSALSLSILESGSSPSPPWVFTEAFTWMIFLWLQTHQLYQNYQAQ